MGSPGRPRQGDSLPFLGPIPTGPAQPTLATFMEGGSCQKASAQLHPPALRDAARTKHRTQPVSHPPLSLRASTNPPHSFLCTRNQCLSSSGHSPQWDLRYAPGPQLHSPRQLAPILSLQPAFSLAGQLLSRDPGVAQHSPCGWAGRHYGAYFWGFSPVIHPLLVSHFLVPKVEPPGILKREKSHRE